MDRTSGFRKLIQKERQLRGISTPSDEILPKSKRFITVFAQEAVEVLKSLHHIRQFIQEHRNSYLNTSGTGLSEAQRAGLEKDVAVFLAKCSKDLENLNLSSSNAHSRALLEFLSMYLKDMSKSFNKLQSLHQEQLKRTRREMCPDDRLVELETVIKRFNPGPDQSRGEFRQENLMLEAQLQNVVEEARQMERKMVEISSLLDTFTEKVVEQHSDIEFIHDSAVQSKENITQGNEQLVKARDYGSGFGFFIFCFLTFLSLILLMLHYFNY